MMVLHILHSYSIEPCIPIDVTSNNSMNFFNNKTILIRENVLHLTDSSLTPGTTGSVIGPDMCIQMLFKS